MTTQKPRKQLQSYLRYRYGRKNLHKHISFTEIFVKGDGVVVVMAM